MSFSFFLFYLLLLLYPQKHPSTTIKFKKRAQSLIVTCLGVAAWSGKQWILPLIFYYCCTSFCNLDTKHSMCSMAAAHMNQNQDLFDIRVCVLPCDYEADEKAILPTFLNFFPLFDFVLLMFWLLSGLKLRLLSWLLGKRAPRVEVTLLSPPCKRPRQLTDYYWFLLSLIWYKPIDFFMEIKIIEMVQRCSFAFYQSVWLDVKLMNGDARLSSYKLI